MINIKNINKNFASLRAINNLSFDVNKGDILGFLGPNGAGKTTAIKIIAGFLQPDNGEVIIDGESFNGQVHIKEKIGYMPENTPLYKDMTAKEYLSFIAEIHCLDNIKKKVAETIEIANLTQVTNRLVETFSKGYKSRLSFASAIIHNPDILLLDEPTDGLDPNQKSEIRQLIKKLSSEKAIIISTHILEEVRAICNKVLVISEGKMLLNGTPSDMQNLYKSNKKIIISLKKETIEKFERTFSTKLDLFEKTNNNSNRYIFEYSDDIEKIISKMQKEFIEFQEIFKYQTTLDETFKYMTESMH